MVVVAAVIVYEHCITRNRYHDVCLVSECPAPRLLRPNPVELSPVRVQEKMSKKIQARQCDMS